MKNERFYKIVIVLLLLLNTGTLAFLWMKSNRPPHGPMGGPGRHNRVDRLMSDKLQFTPQQESLMENLKHEHHSQILRIQEEESKLHTELFGLLHSNNDDPAARKMILDKLAVNDIRKEEVTFEHFRQIRAILTPEQLPKFDELMEEIASHIMSHHPGRKGDMPPPPPPGD